MSSNNETANLASDIAGVILNRAIEGHGESTNLLVRSLPEDELRKAVSLAIMFAAEAVNRGDHSVDYLIRYQEAVRTGAITG